MQRKRGDQKDTREDVTRDKKIEYILPSSPPKSQYNYWLFFNCAVVYSGQSGAMYGHRFTAVYREAAKLDETIRAYEWRQCHRCSPSCRSIL